ncbi:hypothetical protein [Bacillus sp. UMB0893]|nr:hypothetical protein [Bacillus sp. UMB0893]
MELDKRKAEAPPSPAKQLRIVQGQLTLSFNEMAIDQRIRLLGK